MTITRISCYRAKPRAAEGLLTALLELAPAIANSDGCKKVRVLSSLDDPAEFALYEEWNSIEAHRKAAAQLPVALIGKVNALIDAPPRANDYSG